MRTVKDLNEEELKRHDHVVGLANQINTVLAGESMAEAQTAMTLAVACMIVFTSEDGRDRERQAIGFANQLKGFIKREDIVEWIKHFTTPIVTKGGMH